MTRTTLLNKEEIPSRNDEAVVAAVVGALYVVDERGDNNTKQKCIHLLQRGKPSALLFLLSKHIFFIIGITVTIGYPLVQILGLEYNGR